MSAAAGPVRGRAAWGLALLAIAGPVPEPPLVGEVVARLRRDPLARTLTVVLAVRHLAEAAAQARAGRTVTAGGLLARGTAAVDVLHLASLPLLAAATHDPDRRRLVAIDAPVEAVLAALSVRAATTR